MRRYIKPVRPTICSTRLVETTKVISSIATQPLVATFLTNADVVPRYRISTYICSVPTVLFLISSKLRQERAWLKLFPTADTFTGWIWPTVLVIPFTLYLPH